VLPVSNRHCPLLGLYTMYTLDNDEPQPLRRARVWIMKDGESHVALRSCAHFCVGTGSYLWPECCQCRHAERKDYCRICVESQP